jgi:hypothetical protein
MTENKATRTFYFGNELGCDAVVSVFMEQSQLALAVCPAIDDLKDELGEDGVAFIELPDLGENTPDVTVMIRSGKAVSVTVDEGELTAWKEPMRLHEATICESDGFGFLINMETVQEIGDDGPALVLTRGARIFRIMNELPVAVQVACRLEQDRFAMLIDKDPRQASPVFGAAFRAAALLNEPDDEDLNPYFHGILELEGDPAQKTYIVKPHGCFTVVLDEGQLPAWHEPAQLLDFVHSMSEKTAPHASLDLFYDPSSADHLTEVIIAPVDSQASN